MVTAKVSRKVTALAPPELDLWAVFVLLDPFNDIM